MIYDIFNLRLNLIYIRKFFSNLFDRDLTFG